MSMMEEQTPSMSLDAIAKYHEELRKELFDLYEAQKTHPTVYKYQRIVTISQRLGLQVQIDEPEDS